MPSASAAGDLVRAAEADWDQARAATEQAGQRAAAAEARVITRMSTAAAVVPPRPTRDPAEVTGVIAGAGFHVSPAGGIPEGMIPYQGDNGA